MGGQFAGEPMLLLTSTGRKSGRQVTNPLVYTTDGDRVVIIASKGGPFRATRNPAPSNVQANPRVQDRDSATSLFSLPPDATVPEGEERDRLYQAQADLIPSFKEYQENTTVGDPCRGAPACLSTSKPDRPRRCPSGSRLPPPTAPVWGRDGPERSSDFARARWYPGIDAVHSQLAFSVVHLRIPNVHGTFDRFSGALFVGPTSRSTVVVIEAEMASINSGYSMRDRTRARRRVPRCRRPSADALPVDRYRRVRLGATP